NALRARPRRDDPTPARARADRAARARCDPSVPSPAARFGACASLVLPRFFVDELREERVVLRALFDGARRAPRAQLGRDHARVHDLGDLRKWTPIDDVERVSDSLIGLDAVEDRVEPPGRFAR